MNKGLKEIFIGLIIIVLTFIILFIFKGNINPMIGFPIFMIFGSIGNYFFCMGIYDYNIYEKIYGGNQNVRKKR